LSFLSARSHRSQPGQARLRRWAREGLDAARPEV